MAKLKDTRVDGNLEVKNNIILETTENGISGIHPTTGEVSRMIHMSSYGNTIVGYDGYANANANSHIYGDDITFYVASAGNTSYRPYRRAGDSLEVYLRTAGYVTNSGTEVMFFVPFSVPMIGAPTVTVSSNEGLILRQDNKYTHGSAATTYVTPASYTCSRSMFHGVSVCAKFNNSTNVTNNSPIGVYWSGILTFS